jgi:hypothetical protein
LQSLISDRKIISDLRLVTPYTLSRWFMLPIEDILSELQLMDAKVILGTLLLATCMFTVPRRAVRIRTTMRAEPPDPLLLVEEGRPAWFSIADLAPEGASSFMV